MTTGEALMTASEIARLAGVGRAAVGNWRKRHADFPAVAGGSETSPAFRRDEVEAWLRANRKLDDRVDAARLWQRLDAYRWGGRTAAVLAGLGLVLLRGSGDADLGAWAAEHHPDLLPALDDGVGREALALAEDALAVAGRRGGAALFEELCRRFVDARVGQVHATPPELAALMVELSEVDDGVALDPACGTGGLLLAAFRGGAGAMAVYGQEIEPTAAMLARVRLAVAGAPSTIAVGDTLRHDAFEGRVRADGVVTNPPFGLRDWQGEEAFADPRWTFGVPPRSEPELAWVQHCLAHLDVEGRAVVIMPPGAASRAPGRRLRAELVRHGRLVAVIALPPGTLPETAIAPLLWVLTDDVGADPDDGVVMIDASAPVRGRRVDWPAVRRIVVSSLIDPDAPGPDVARRVPAIELLDDEVSLLPQRHLRAAPAPTVDLGATRDRLLALLQRAHSSVPSVPESSPSSAVRWTPLGELARSGALELLSSSRPEVDDEGDGPAVLLARDVVAGRAPSGHLAAAPEAKVVELRAGDVVLPMVAHRPVARVIEKGGALLGANLVAVRARPEAFDPWYLAGVLQGDHVVRSSTTGSGAFRISPRSVEVPVVPLVEQEPLAMAFRRLAELEVALAHAAEIGAELAENLRSGLVDGSLRPGDETLTTPSASTTSSTSEGDA